MDSVLTQEGLGTQFDVQVIVVDDASSDSTPDVMSRYPNVHYTRLESQRGAAAARNVGLRASTGDYIAFLDDDDLWLPHKLQVQLAVLEKHRDVAVVYSQAVTIQEGSPAFLYPDASSAPSGWVFKSLLRMGCFCPHPAVLLLRHEVFQTVGHFDEQLRAVEDFDLWLRVSLRFPFHFIPGAVSVYHSTSQGLYFTAVRHGSAAEYGRKVIHRALEALPKTPDNEKLRREILFRMEAHSALRKALFAPPEEKWRATLAVLASLPEMLRYRWGREAATNVVPLIVAADAPLAAGRTWCRELRTAVPGRSLAHWFRMQLTVGAIWTQTAVELARGPFANISAARVAALLAILHNPAKLRVKELRHLIVGALKDKLRRRAPERCGVYPPGVRGALRNQSASPQAPSGRDSHPGRHPKYRAALPGHNGPPPAGVP